MKKKFDFSEGGVSTGVDVAHKEGEAVVDGYPVNVNETVEEAPPAPVTADPGVSTEGFTGGLYPPHVQRNMEQAAARAAAKATK